MCWFNDSCTNIKKNISKAFDTKIELKSSGYDTTFSLEIDQDMMLLPSPYGNENQCQLPFFSIDQPHVRYGSLLLKKYNIFYDLENKMMGIGLKNEDFKRTYPDPISPVVPDQPKSDSSSAFVWVLLTLTIGFVFGAIAYKMGWICKKKKDSSADETIMWDDPDKSGLMHT